MEFPQPNFTNGFARNSTESLYPHLWKSLIFCMSPSVGRTGDYIIDWSGNFKKAPFPTQDSLATWVNDGKFAAPCIEFAAYGGGYSVNNKGIFFNQFDNDTSYPQNFIGNGTYQKGYTFSFWFKGTAANLQPFLHAQLNNYQDSANYLYFFISGNLSTNINGANLNTTKPMLDGKWHHMVFVVSQATTYLYVDNVLTGSQATNNYSLTVPGGMSIGAPGNVGAGASWRLGDFFIWNRPITANEINALYSGATPLALAPMSIVTSSPNSTVDPTILTLVSSIESPTIVIDTTVEPTILTIASEIVSPADVGNFVIVEPTVLDIVSSLESPFVSIDCTVTPSILTLVSSIESPAIPQHMTVTPDVLTIESELVPTSFMGEPLGTTIRRITF